MRRNKVAVRIAAALLAVSMSMTDAIPMAAAQVKQTQERVGNTQEIKGTVNSVSKVIGFDGRPSVNTLSNYNGTVNRKYAETNWNENNGSVYVRGSKADYLDSYTGYYKYGNDLYKNAVIPSDNIVRLHNKVAWYTTVETGADAASVTPKLDQVSGFYLAPNGKYYAQVEKRAVRETDATGKSKVVRTTYIVRPQDEVIWLGALNETVTEEASVTEPAKRLYGRKLDPADPNVSYYEANGATYSEINVKYSAQKNKTTGNTEYKVTGAYVYAKNQITFDSCYHRVYWQEVSNMTEIESNGKAIDVGYQVKVNGEVVPLDDMVFDGSTFVPMTTEISYRHPVLRMAGEAANYEVRAIYYTTDETETKNLVKAGEWSDVYTYAWGGTKQTIPAVTNLTYTQKDADTIMLFWDFVDVASAYYVQRLYSVDQISDFSALEGSWKTLTESTQNTNYQTSNNDYGNTTVMDANGNRQIVDYKYAYYRVAARLTYDSQDFAHSVGPYSNILCVPEHTAANTPAITGLKVDYKTDGTFDLRWNNIDKKANVTVFYSTDKKMFQTPEYLYELAAAEGIDNKGTETTADDTRIRLVNTASLSNTLKLVKKKVKSVSCAAGTNTISSQKMDLVPGKKYYFVVVTYDNVNYATDRSAFTPYVVNVAKVSGETRNVAFGYYNDVMPSKIVSAKETLNISEPSTKSQKTSIAMTFKKEGTNITGFEIYRKKGKKYKKIATTTASYYTDSNLQKSTVYDYKARAYYYNPNTKQKAYSDYVCFSAETGVSNNIGLKLEKKSKTSVKLTWTKVSGAVRYEIYRSNTSSTNHNASQKYGYGTGISVLSNEKWELVKSIKKAKTTTYTDKKLKSGMDYSYRIVAYYKSGKKEKSVYAADFISLQMTTPRDVNVTLKDSKVKVTWDKDAYASKYEVSYKRYHEDQFAYDDAWTVVTTKKNSYTIKNVGKNDSVVVRVRAYGGKKWSSYSTEIYQSGIKKTVVKKISAKEITETNTKGAKKSAVKISWKKVSGAAYYCVYRTTSPVSQYSKEYKSYYAPNDNMEYIAKESNTDENYHSIAYSEYKNKKGTVVGTSAIDRAVLQNGVLYYYYVEAYNKDGERISEGYHKPASICYKATPRIKKITAKKGKTVISIQKVKGAKKYVIYRSTKKNKGFKKIATTTKTTYTDKKTKKNKTYYYKVVAVGTNGLKADFESNASKAVKVKAK